MGRQKGQRAAGRGRARRDATGFGQGRRGRTHHGSDEFGTQANPSAHARDQREEKPEMTAHALLQGAEPRQARSSGLAPPSGEGRGCQF